MHDSLSLPGAGLREPVEEVEISLLMEALRRHLGVDYANRERPALRRSIWRAMQAEGTRTVSGLQEALLHVPGAAERFRVRVAAEHPRPLFHDPEFYRVFRSEVLPLFRTEPLIRLWLPGCGVGEEAYSLAILLTEAGLYRRARIYATDTSEALLALARVGACPARSMREATQNYLQAGGKRPFSSYYEVRGDRAILRPELREKILWARHDPVEQGPFHEFHAIVCRDGSRRPAQASWEEDRCFLASLAPSGVLGLGRSSSAAPPGASPLPEGLVELNREQRIYQRAEAA